MPFMTSVLRLIINVAKNSWAQPKLLKAHSPTCQEGNQSHLMIISNIVKHTHTQNVISYKKEDNSYYYLLCKQMLSNIYLYLWNIIFDIPMLLWMICLLSWWPIGRMNILMHSLKERNITVWTKNSVQVIWLSPQQLDLCRNYILLF